MAKLLMNQKTLPQFREAILRLEEDASPAWGKLTCPGMLAHLIFMMELSLEKQTTRDISNFFTRRAIVRKAIMEWMFWPKGKINAPRAFTPKPKGEFEALRQQLLSLLEDFCGELEKDPKRLVNNPVWGPITLHYWSVIHGRHTAWHLEQFGQKVSG